MRIGLVIESFDPRRGGAEVWCCQFAERLLRRGHEVHVVARNFADVTKKLHIQRHRLTAAYTRLGFAAAAERKLSNLSLDIIHDMGSGWYCDVFQSHDGSRFAQWEQKTASLPPWCRPLKRAMIAALPRYAIFRRLMARQYPTSKLIVALSQMCAEDFRRYHHVAPERIRLVYNGVDVDRFSPANRDQHRKSLRNRLGVGDSQLLLLFVGRDFRRKGLAVAIQALARSPADARLAVLGGGDARAYRRLAQRLGIGDRVNFLGATGDGAPYYAAADALLLPTTYDPCSLSVLEAAASGLPAITTQFNGAAELLTSGVDGYVLSDPSDDAGVAAAICFLLDPAVRQRMGAAARRMALMHSLDRNCDEMLAVYYEIAGRKCRAA